MIDNYEDIINITHFEPKHKRMSLYNRAAQFAPFAALTGYDDEIKETGRITDSKINLINEEKIKINNFLIEIKNIINNRPLIKVKYFVKDSKKNGGKYIDYIGNIKFIDEINLRLKFIDNKIINIKDIIDISFI